MRLPLLLVSLGVLAVGGGGVLTAVAVSSSQQGEPTRTVTLDIPPSTTPGPPGPKGDTGPAGATGPQGPAGDPSDCGTGFTYSLVVINAPGGQVQFKSCVKD